MPKATCTIPDCSAQMVARGWCDRHWKRWRKWGDPLGQPARTPAERFWIKVDKDGPLPPAAALGPCWVWTGGRHKGGTYGVFWDGTRYLEPHVMSYELENGRVPTGHCVDHICHRPLCVRPSHLRVVTPGQNQQNRSGSQRGSSSRFRGVYWNKKQKRWFVRVTVAGKVHWGGSFLPHQEDEAGEVARAMRLRLMTHNNADRIA